MPKRSPSSLRNGALQTRGFDYLHSCQISTSTHAEEFYEKFVLPSNSKRPRRRLGGLPDRFERPLSEFRPRRRRVPSLENRLSLNFSGCKKLENKCGTVEDGVDLRKQLEWKKMLHLSDA